MLILMPLLLRVIAHAYRHVTTVQYVITACCHTARIPHSHTSYRLLSSSVRYAKYGSDAAYYADAAFAFISAIAAAYTPLLPPVFITPYATLMLISRVFAIFDFSTYAAVDIFSLLLRRDAAPPPLTPLRYCAMFQLHAMPCYAISYAGQPPRHDIDYCCLRHLRHAMFDIRRQMLLLR